MAPRPKSRVTAEKVHVYIHMGDDTGHAGDHMGGSFAESGYRAGIGQFGFRHDVTTSEAAQ